LEKDRDFAKKKPKKKVLYSDKSESSIDEMMEDTPSNYNIPNGRLDGKSLGLKAMVQQAKMKNLSALAQNDMTNGMHVSNTPGLGS